MSGKDSGLILYLDAAILVANKPAGLPTLPEGYKPEAPYLVRELEAGAGKLYVVHRLDKETSGVIVLARTADAHKVLNTAFEARQVSKIYHALVGGSPAWDEQRVTAPLLPDGDRAHRTIVSAAQGKPAATLLKVLERYRGYSLVEARPETGRTHQIRVHLAFLGSPVAGDDQYGKGEGIYLSRAKPGYRLAKGEIERPLLDRVALHAFSLAFPHPESGEVMTFEAPYPKDFAAALKQLRRYR